MSTPAIAAEPVLLVGNSFAAGTYEQIPQKSTFKDRAVGGYNLDQHFRDSSTRSSICICAGRTFVLLQDFSTRARDIDLFNLDMDEMIPYVWSCDAVPVLFMTWETISIDFRTVRSAYEQAAARHDVQIVPVGLVFNQVRARSESLYQSFIQTDGKHPTTLGAKVAAASILKAFCSSCYQSFNWSGFTSSEISLIRGIIDQHVYRVRETQPPNPEEPEPPIVDEPNRSYLPAVLSLLLDNGA